MSLGKTCSREELRELHEKYRKERIYNFIHTTIYPEVIEKARNGHNYFFWEMLVPKPVREGYPTELVAVDPPFPFEQLVPALKEKFPGATVEVEERIVERPRGKTEIKRGIRIDWS